MKTLIYRRLILGVYALFMVACTTLSPDQWADSYQDLVIYEVHLVDNVGAYSPINVGLSLETEKGGLNRRDSLSVRAQKRMYKALEEALQSYVSVQHPLEEKEYLFAQYPGWPDYSEAEARAIREADLYVSLRGEIKARQMDVTVKGVTVQRSVPVLKLQLRASDREGKVVYQRQGKQVGDPTMGGSLDVGNWSLDKGMVVREREVLDLFEALIRELLTP